MSSGADIEHLQPLELRQHQGFFLDLVFFRFRCFLYCSVPFDSSAVFSFSYHYMSVIGFID